MVSHRITLVNNLDNPTSNRINKIANIISNPFGGDKIVKFSIALIISLTP